MAAKIASIRDSVGEPRLAARSSVAIAVFFGFTKTNPFANPYELRAAFTDAAPGVTVVDSTHLSLAEVVDHICRLADQSP